MNDDNIKDILEQYVIRSMDMLQCGNMPGSDHEYSESYNKRIKRVLRYEKIFGKHISAGYKFVRAAVIILALIGILAAGEVSARIWGFSPWKYIVSYVEESKMERKRYTGINTQDGMGKEISIIAKRYIPDYVPEGYEQTRYENIRGDVVYVEWINADGSMISHSKMGVTDGLSVMTDAEYTGKEEINIGILKGIFYEKGDECWITWDDSGYNCDIYAFDTKDTENVKNELIKMAESLY